jgi:hypothetical protein
MESTDLPFATWDELMDSDFHLPLFQSPCDTLSTCQQQDFDARTTAQRHLYEERLSTQRSEYEARLDALRRECGELLATQQRDCEALLEAQRRDFHAERDALMWGQGAALPPPTAPPVDPLEPFRIRALACTEKLEQLTRIPAPFGHYDQTAAATFLFRTNIHQLMKTIKVLSPHMVKVGELADGVKVRMLREWSEQGVDHLDRVQNPGETRHRYVFKADLRFIAMVEVLAVLLQAFPDLIMK